MKIGDIKESSAQMIQQYQKADNSGHVAEQQSPLSYTQEEKVDLSNKAKDIQKIRNAVDKLPEIREDRVVALKGKIEAGKYAVNNNALAEKIVRESLIDIFA